MSKSTEHFSNVFIQDHLVKMIIPCFCGKTSTGSSFLVPLPVSYAYCFVECNEHIWSRPGTPEFAAAIEKAKLEEDVKQEDVPGSATDTKDISSNKRSTRSTNPRYDEESTTCEHDAIDSSTAMKGTGVKEMKEDEDIRNLPLGVDDIKKEGEG
jgi:hypothetical protein